MELARRCKITQSSVGSPKNKENLWKLFSFFFDTITASLRWSWRFYGAPVEWCRVPAESIAFQSKVLDMWAPPKVTEKTVYTDWAKEVVMSMHPSLRLKFQEECDTGCNVHRLPEIGWLLWGKPDAGTDRINGSECLLVFVLRSVIKSFTLTTAHNIIYGDEVNRWRWQTGCHNTTRLPNLYFCAV